MMFKMLFFQFYLFFSFQFINTPEVGKRRISPSVMLTKKMANELYLDSINKKQPIKANDESK